MNNLTEYLKTEFQVYPIAFRDIANFLTKEDVAVQILKPALSEHCASCGAPALSLNDVVTKSGVRYLVSCKCGHKGPMKASEAEARWAWNAMKGMPALSLGNPLVNQVRYQKMLSRFSSTQQILSWVCALNIHKKLWLAHRDTADYERLNQDEKSFVDSLGILNGLLKKEAVALLDSKGVTLASDSVQLMMSSAEMSVTNERKAAYHKYKNLLPQGFHSKVRDIIGA